MNPKRLGKKAHHHQEPWQVPLPHFMEQPYLKRFGKQRPENVSSIDEIVLAKKEKWAVRTARTGETPGIGGNG